MTLTTIALHVALLAVSVATTAGLAIYGWRHRSDPGARTFAGLMLAFTWYSSSHLLGVLTYPPRWRLLLESVQWIGGALAPVFWLAFTMEYTGYDELFDRKILGLLLVVPGLTIVASWTNQWYGLMWAVNEVVMVDGLALLSQEFGPWFCVNTVYTIGLVGTGSFLILRLISRSDYLYADQSILLIVGVAVPVVAIVFSVFEIPPLQEPLLDLTPYAFAVTGISFGYALFRYRLLEVMPATRQIGRRAAVTSLEDGVLILDTARRIIYINPEAAAVFDCEPSAVLGQPVGSLVTVTELDFDTEDGPLELDLKIERSRSGHRRSVTDTNAHSGPRSSSRTLRIGSDANDGSVGTSDDGRRILSIRPFQTCRLSSYSAASGRTRAPRRRSSRDTIASSSNSPRNRPSERVVSDVMGGRFDGLRPGSVSGWLGSAMVRFQRHPAGSYNPTLDV